MNDSWITPGPWQCNVIFKPSFVKKILTKISNLHTHLLRYILNNPSIHHNSFCFVHILSLRVSDPSVLNSSLDLLLSYTHPSESEMVNIRCSDTRYKRTAHLRCNKHFCVTYCDSFFSSSVSMIIMCNNYLVLIINFTKNMYSWLKGQ